MPTPAATPEVLPERVSLAADGGQSGGDAAAPALSADGRYVAFDSDAADLVPGDSNGTRDIFVRDRLAGTTERVSVSTGGLEAHGDSYAPSISGDGDRIVFVSEADDLVAGDQNQVADIFLHQRSTGETRRLSVGLAGFEGGGASDDPMISSDGRWVTFVSRAGNFDPPDAGGSLDVFLLDLEGGTPQQITAPEIALDAEGLMVAGGDQPWISGDGRFLAFRALARWETNTRVFSAGIWLYDRERDELTPESMTLDGEQAQADSPSISDDGRWLTFASRDFAMLSWGRVRQSWSLDVYLVDRETKQRWNLNQHEDRRRYDRVGPPVISADGRRVAFASDSYVLLDGNTYHGTDVYLHDRITGETTRRSAGLQNDRGGYDGDSCSVQPALSNDGSIVAFKSTATNLVVEDTNEAADVFLSEVEDVCETDDDCTVASECMESLGCDVESGRCVSRKKHDQTLCSGGENQCAEVGVCQAGVCVPVQQETCTQPREGGCLESSRCDPQFGGCIEEFKPGGSECTVLTEALRDPDCSVRTGACRRFQAYRCMPVDGASDHDVDGVCTADDNCPNSNNRDQSDHDGDGIGDICDEDYSGLYLRRVNWRAGESRGWRVESEPELVKGQVSISGHYVLAPGESARDAQGGITFELRGGADSVQMLDFRPQHCEEDARGGFRCDRSGTQELFIEAQKRRTRRDGSVVYRLRIEGTVLCTKGEVFAPVSLRLIDRATRSPRELVLGDSLSSCTRNAWSHADCRDTGRRPLGRRY